MEENKQTRSQRIWTRFQENRARKAEAQLRRKQLLSIVSALIASCVALAAGITAIYLNKIPGVFKVHESDASMTSIRKLDAELGILKLRIAQWEAIALIATNPPKITSSVVAIAEVSLQVSNVTARIKALEDAISSSPDKALAIPLMRKDLDLIQKTQNDERAGIKAEVERLYDFNKWFFGLIATMAVSILGLAIANAFRSPKDAKEEPRPQT